MCKTEKVAYTVVDSDDKVTHLEVEYDIFLRTLTTNSITETDD